MNHSFTNSNLFKTIWELISPLLIYYVGYYVGYFLIAMMLSANHVTELPEYANPVIGGICMLCGLLALIPEMRQERHFDIFPKERGFGIFGVTIPILSYFLAVICAIFLVVCLNHLILFSGLSASSDSFQEVAKSQYSVPIWLGIILYGIIAPLAEEMVFRYTIFKKLTRLSGRMGYGLFVSSFLFAIYHGNIVQGIYSFLLGAFFAYALYRSGKILVPIFCHGIGNIVIYLCTMVEELYNIVFHPITLSFMWIGIVLLFLAEKKQYEQQKMQD